MMTQELFNNKVKEMISEKLTTGESILINPVQKTNVTLLGLTISKAGCNISPTIYLDGFYKDYCHGCDIESIVNSIWDMYQSHRLTTSVDISDFFNFEKQRENVRCKLINYDANQQLLQDIPYKRFLDDLAIVFYLDMSETIPDATILIHNSHVKGWNTSTDELVSIANENSAKYDNASIVNIISILEQLTGEETPSEDYQLPMYVMSNASKLFGARTILRTDLLKQFCDKIHSDIWVICSSVHEAILLPMNCISTRDDVSGMMTLVNDTEVAPEEILSYHPYHFIRETGQFSLA